jgi:hypothetical protein
MEVVTPPSVGASFKKWGCCRHTPPKSLGPYYMQGPEFFIKKGSKDLQKKKKKKKGLVAAGLVRLCRAGPGTGKALTCAGQGPAGKVHVGQARVGQAGPPFWGCSPFWGASKKGLPMGGRTRPPLPHALHRAGPSFGPPCGGSFLP